MSPMAGIPLHCTACTQARGAGVWDRSQTPSSLHSALSPVKTVVHQTLLVQCNAGGGRVPAQLAWLITRPTPLCLCRAIIAAHNLQLLPDYASHNEHWTLNSSELCRLLKSSEVSSELCCIEASFGPDWEVVFLAHRLFGTVGVRCNSPYWPVLAHLCSSSVLLCAGVFPIG